MARLQKTWPAAFVLAILASAATGAMAESLRGQKAKSSALPIGSRVCVAPWIGPPDATSRLLQEAMRKRISEGALNLVECGLRGDSLVLRTYIVAAVESPHAVKVSYVVDVKDASEVRKRRIVGDYMLPPAPDNKDPWAALTDDIARRIGWGISEQLLQ